MRFANDNIGYAYGATSLYMTLDGGRRWNQQPGGAIALETAGGNVVRVTASSSGCPAWCNIKIFTAPIGTSRWTRANLPRAQMPLGGFGIELARSGNNVYLLNLGHPAGGGSRATSDLYVSHDNGQHWTVRPEPCPQIHHEVDSLAITAAPPEQVTVECAPRYLSPARHAFIATSNDAGATFRRQPGNIPFHAIGTVLAGDPAHALLAADWTLATRSPSRPWRLVDGITNQITYAGFQNPTTARVISDNQHRLWTTHDSGATWRPAIIR